MTDGRSYIFHLSPFTPETLPLERLAEYASALAEVFGHSEAVHLQEIESGSVKLALKVDQPVAASVETRLAEIAMGAGPDEARRAVRRITGFLARDGGTATLDSANDNATVLTFSTLKPVLPPISVTETGCLDGRIVRLGGSREEVTVSLETDNGRITCALRRSLAKEMAPYLFDWVRVAGTGTWERSSHGKWLPASFTIHSFEPLDDTSLTDLLARVRSLTEAWPDSDTIQTTLRDMRD